MASIEGNDSCNGTNKLHANYFINALIKLEKEFKTNLAESLLAFDRDLENIRAAWLWMISQGEDELLQPGIDGLRLFCTMSSRYHTLVQLLEPMLEPMHADSSVSGSKNGELKVLVSLGTAYLSIGGLISPQTASSFERATQLAIGLDTSPELFATLNSLSAYYWCNADFTMCLVIIDQWRSRLAAKKSKPEKLENYLEDAEVIVKFIEGAVRYQLGEFREAEVYLKQGIALYKPEKHVDYITTYGQDPSVFCRVWLAKTYWALGKLDDAKSVAKRAVKLSETMEHPFTKMFAQCAVLEIANFAKDYDCISSTADIVCDLAKEGVFAVFQAIGNLSKALVLCSVDNDITVQAQGLKTVEACLEVFNVQVVSKETYAAQLAQIYISKMEFDKAQNLIDEVLEFVDRTDSRCALVELLQLKGQASAAQGLNDRAEALFTRAIEVVRKQDAMLPELRASTSYAGYLKEQHRTLEAADLLSTAYLKFEQGSKTADLKHAKSLLDSLQQT